MCLVDNEIKCTKLQYLINFGLWHTFKFTADNTIDSDIQLRRRTDRGSLKRYSLKYEVIETDFPENIDEKKLFIFFEEGNGKEGTYSAHDYQFALYFSFHH